VRLTTREFTVVGTAGFGDEKNHGGTTSAFFDTATAQQRAVRGIHNGIYRLPRNISHEDFNVCHER
jgi:hypothetical protein